MEKIYLDNCMTTRPSERAVSAMMPYLNDLWGVPTAPHQMGQSLIPALKQSYRSLYELIGADDSDAVVFTSSGAEAVNNVFLSGYLELTVAQGKNHFVVGQTDEAPALMAMNRLEELGCVRTYLPVNRQGIVTPEALGDVITPRTAMVSLSWANGLTGVVQPVQELAALCQDRGILFHLDATHVLGKLYFDLKEVGADLISFNGDHIHAPKGTGGMYIKKEVPWAPLILGGMEQGGLRAGPVNLPGLVALGVAANEAIESRDLLCIEVARLRNQLEEKVLNSCPGSQVFFSGELRLPHVSAMGFSGISNEALLFLLNRKGVFAGIGGGSFQQIGMVLKACGIEESLAHSAISFSLSRETTEDEIDRAAEAIAEAVQTLKKVSIHIDQGAN